MADVTDEEYIGPGLRELAMQWSDLKFETNGLIPVVVQDADSDQVLMMAYMNREALQRTIETGRAWYWSRSRQKLWLKGETSGHYQVVRSIIADCDGDLCCSKWSSKAPGACHQGYKTCFHYELTDGDKPWPWASSQFDPGNGVRWSGAKTCSRICTRYIATAATARQSSRTPPTYSGKGSTKF